MTTRLASILLFVSLFGIVFGGFGSFEEDEIKVDKLTGSRSAMFTVEDAPFGLQQPFIQFNGTQLVAVLRVLRRLAVACACCSRWLNVLCSLNGAHACGACV